MGYFFFFFQAEDGIRDIGVTGVQTCALPIYVRRVSRHAEDHKTKLKYISEITNPQQTKSEKHYEIGRASCRERV